MERAAASVIPARVAAAFAGVRDMARPLHEPVCTYAPGTRERVRLKARLSAMAGERIEIPVIVGGKEYWTGDVSRVVMPHAHGHVLAEWHAATPALAQQAIESAREAYAGWSRWDSADRASVFLRAAELLATSWRDTLNAATMLGQSKTAFQSEIDAACELIDLYRFNAWYAQRLFADQPGSAAGTWNSGPSPAAVTPITSTAPCGRSRGPASARAWKETRCTRLRAGASGSRTSPSATQPRLPSEVCCSPGAGSPLATASAAPASVGQ